LPDIAKTLGTVALAGCLAGAAAGCGGTPAGHPAATASAAGTPSPSPSTSPGSPRTQILNAYEGMWHDYTVAARTADYQASSLSQYAAGNALMVLTRSLLNDHQQGVVLRGAPVLNPQVTAMTPAADPDSSSVSDCADDSDWLQYTSSGQPASGAPAGRHRVYAQLQLFGPVWKVTSLVVEAAGSC
jgi:hypothetical protein